MAYTAKKDKNAQSRIDAVAQEWLPKSAMNFNNKELKTILIVNLGGVGDFLHSQMGLRALRAHYEESSILFLGIARVAELARKSPYFDEVIVFNYDPCKALLLFLKLRQRKIDLAVNMRTLVSWKGACLMALFFFLAGVKYKAGRDTAGRGFFLDIKIPETDFGDMAEYEYDVNLIEALGVKVSDRQLEIIVSEEDKEYVRGFLSRCNIDQKDLVIGINPGGVSSNLFPVEEFAKVIQRLLQGLKAHIVITGTENERHLFEKLRALTQAPLINAVGKTSIFQLQALIQRCNLYITNDSGPMHIAAFLRVPLIAIFAGGQIRRFDPRNIEANAVVFRQEIDCSPCNKKHCRVLRCVKNFSSEEIAKASISLLDRRGII